ncbi:serine hydroxymethyltransferase, partial [Vibrio parahaemolyticus]|nr:serine hydroxymethyltransferase [Vibrio parahaemolyticus]
SGIRLGTPALTTRGMKEPEMQAIGQMIAAVISDPESESVKREIRGRVAELTARFPMYQRRLNISYAAVKPEN